jgi:hypothetical protein
MALLLLVALLFCHGFMGAFHQLPDPPEHSRVMGEHSSHAPAGGSGGHSGLHLGHSDYAAVLISILFGAIIGLLSGVRMWRGLTAPQFPERTFPPLILHPARGPTAPLIQVFRL